MVSNIYHEQELMRRDHAARILLQFFETAVFFFVLLYFSGAVAGLLFTSTEDVAAGDSSLGRMLWYPIYALVLLLSLKSLPQIFRAATFTPLIILCVMWFGMSMLWSIDPSVTLRRSIALLMTTLCGFALAARYDWNEMVQRIAFVFLVLAVLSLLTALLWPTKGIMHEIHEGAWRGLWGEKNYLGGIMTKGLIACMCAFAMRPDRWWLWLPGGLLCFLLVIMSTSKTALIISLVSIGLFVAIRIFRRRPILRIPLLYFSVMAFSLFTILMLIFPAEILGLIGKDPTFTGRTDIWVLLIESIREKIVLGYGYGAYWLNELGPSYTVRTSLEWGVPSAHNGWVEIWLSGGVVIVALFGLHYLITLLLSINRLKHGGVESYWAILSTLMFLFFSMSESTILARNDLTWVLFVATSVKLFSFERPYWRNVAEH